MKIRRENKIHMSACKQEQESEPEFILGLDNENNHEAEPIEDEVVVVEEEEVVVCGKRPNINEAEPSLIDKDELPFYMDLIQQVNDRVRMQHRTQGYISGKRKEKVIQTISTLEPKEAYALCPPAKEEKVEIPDSSSDAEDLTVENVVPPEEDEVIESKPFLKHINLEIYPDPGAKLPECSQCTEIFKTVSDFKEHMRVQHVPGLPYRCSDCPKHFRTSSLLRQHKRFHGPKSYTCAICLEGFPFETTLLRHVKIHTNERPFQCSFCDSAFTQSGNLSRHIDRVHTPFKTKDYECITCEKKFTSKQSLTRHCRLSSHIC